MPTQIKLNLGDSKCMPTEYIPGDILEAANFILILCRASTDGRVWNCLRVWKSDGNREGITVFTPTLKHLKPFYGTITLTGEPTTST